MYIGFWPFVVWLCNDCSLWSSCEMITNVDILRYRFVCTVLYCLVESLKYKFIQKCVCVLYIGIFFREITYLNIGKFSLTVYRSIFWHKSFANGL